GSEGGAGMGAEGDLAGQRHDLRVAAAPVYGELAAPGSRGPARLAAALADVREPLRLVALHPAAARRRDAAVGSDELQLLDVARARAVDLHPEHRGARTGPEGRVRGDAPL